MLTKITNTSPITPFYFSHGKKCVFSPEWPLVVGEIPKLKVSEKLESYLERNNS